MSHHTKGLAPLTNQDVVAELAEPYSLMRQRLALFLALRRHNQALVERYNKFLIQRRRLRKLIRIIRRLFKKRRKRILFNRALKFRRILENECFAIRDELHRLKLFQMQLVKEYNFYPVFDIKSESRLFRFINSNSSHTEDDHPEKIVHMRFRQFSSHELKFLEAQLQSLPAHGIEPVEKTLERMERAFSVVLNMTPHEAFLAVRIFLNQYTPRSQYALTFSMDSMRRLQEYLSEIKRILIRIEQQLADISIQIDSLHQECSQNEHALAYIEPLTFNLELKDNSPIANMNMAKTTDNGL